MENQVVNRSMMALIVAMMMMMMIVRIVLVMMLMIVMIHDNVYNGCDDVEYQLYYFFTYYRSVLLSD